MMYEYKLGDIGSDYSEAERRLDKLGLDGWDIIQIGPILADERRYAFAKRPVPHYAVAVPADQLKYPLGDSGGAAGDHLATIVIIPEKNQATDPVLLWDGDTSTPVYPGGNPQASPIPIALTLNVASQDGPWAITTGAGVSVLVTGRFS